MNNLVELTEFLVKKLVSNPDMVSVKEFPSDNENEITIIVMADETDLPKLIGKGGRVANSIRTIVSSASRLKDNKKVNIKIEN